MANVSYNSALVERMIGIGMQYRAELPTMQYVFQGEENSDAAFWVLDRTSNKRGDQITVNFAIPEESDYAKPATAKTVGEAGDAAEPLTQTLQMRYAKKDGRIINEQLGQMLVSYDIGDHQRSNTARDWSQLLEKWLARQLAGTTACPASGGGTLVVNNVPDYLAGWGNATVAPNTENHIMCRGVSGAHTTEAQVAADSTAVMTTKQIRLMEKMASSADYGNYPFAPCDTPYGPLFVLLVHHDGYEQIKENSTGSDLYDLSSKMLQGGQDWLDNYLVQGGDGFIYSDTLVLRWSYAPLGQSSSTAYQPNCRRSMFFGRQALHILYGEGFGDGNHFQYLDFQQLEDVWYLLKTIQGGLVSIVDGKRWASIVCTHYSSV